jgi:UV DNA damage endonuclease
VIRIPIVFDYHHHRFCTGGQTEGEALQLAASTWYGVTPVVHLSESRRAEQKDEKIKEQAHSDYIYNPVDNYGVKYDMMLECKKKELALLKYRDILELGEDSGTEEKTRC